MQEERTLIHSLLKLESLPSSMIATKSKKNGVWKEETWKEYFQNVQNIGHAFLSLGIQKGDRVILVSQTRPEWSRLDFGIMGIGAITVPIYPNSISKEMKHIIQETEAKVVILENDEQIKRWMEIEKECEKVESLVLIEGEEFSQLKSSCMSWSDFLNKGKEHKKNHGEEFLSLCKKSRPEDLATFIYTSGTTGTPKGAVLTQRQIYSEVKESFDYLSVFKEDVFLTFLPLSHVFGRLESWGHIYTNHTLAFAESIESIGENLQEVQPTLMLSVPRIFEKIHSNLLLKVESSPMKKKLFYWALSVGQSMSLCLQKKQNPSFWLRLKHFFATRLVFSKLHKKLGNRMRSAISGGAPLSPQIIEFFHAAGLLILEGYGLTETSAAICCNHQEDYEFGTVGKPIGDVKIQLAEDGEILVKSDKVMKEYYKKPGITREVFNKEGYFKTGDIGEWTERGFLRITDRKKDLIKTSGGKYVAPQKIENILKLNRYISNVLIHGEGRKYMVALITLEKEVLKKYFNGQEMKFENLKKASENPKVFELIEKAVEDTNARLSRHEQIKKFALLGENFSIESGELTPSLKVKRRVCDEKYKHILDSLY